MTNKEMMSPTEGPSQVKILNDFAFYFIQLRGLDGRNFTPQKDDF